MALLPYMEVPNNNFFVSYFMPFTLVFWDTASNWVKTVMEKSGTDVNLFKPQSTKAAATPKVFWKTVQLEHILSVAYFISSTDTFAKFYKKPVINTDNFTNILLQN